MPITSCNEDVKLLELLEQTVSVKQALSDLLPLTQGENSSIKTTFRNPEVYQEFMRGFVSPGAYLKKYASSRL